MSKVTAAGDLQNFGEEGRTKKLECVRVVWPPHRRVSVPRRFRSVDVGITEDSFGSGQILVHSIDAL